MTAYFEVRNLHKSWPGTRIDFSCSVEKGKMLGIAGHSGSGKSTVLRIIAGLLEADRENERKTETAAPCEPLVLRLNGCDIDRLVPAKRNIGMVFQSASLFPHMRVDDNVAYGLRCAGMSKKQSRMQAAEFLKNFGLEGFASRYPDSLSGGEAQRVSLARTLIVRPSLVLFDEPFSSLDAPLRKKLATDIRDLQKKIGFTGIVVTHDINEAKAMCDIMTVLKKGRQTWTGSPEDFNENLI